MQSHKLFTCLTSTVTCVHPLQVVELSCFYCIMYGGAVASFQAQEVQKQAQKQW